MDSATTQHVRRLLGFAVVVCALTWGMQFALAVVDRAGVLAWVAAALALAALAVVGHTARVAKRAGAANDLAPTRGDTSAAGPSSD